MVCSNLSLSSADLHLSLELEHGRMNECVAFDLCLCRCE